MRGFGRRRQRFGGSANSSMLVSVLIFLIVLLGFVYAIGETTQQTLQEQKQNLEAAVEQSLLQCYVIEGRYPQDFAYLEEHYGISYNKEQFRVDVIDEKLHLKICLTILLGRNLVCLRL